MNDPSTDPPSRADDHHPGDTLQQGRYAITGKLGEGGQATTFDAIDKRQGRRVTVKRFRVRGASSWKEVELAEREAKVLAHLTHPNLPVYVDHFEEHGCLYLVTERIDGDTVARLRDRGPCTEADVLRFLADASAVLDYLHSRTPPIVHRDIKPSNVLRRPDGSFAIIDFGAVRDRLKSTGSTVVGTFGYMAPEQFQGRAMPVSDVYAVGTTAIAMLTGQEPEDLPHKGLAIDVVTALGPRANPAMVRALTAMVEPDPDRRAPRISALLSDLQAAASPQQPRSETRGSTPPPRAPAPDARPRAPHAQPDDPAARGGIPRGVKDAAEEQMERVVEEAGDQVRRVVAEVGDQVLRVVDEMAHNRDREGMKREARRLAEVAKREIKRAAKQAKRDARRGRGESLVEGASEGDRDRDRARDRDRDPRAPEPLPGDDRPRGAPLGGPVLAVVLLGLTLAQLAVLLALRVVAPVVLYVVSAMFFTSVPGRAMRRAAGHVAAAGKRAVTAIGRAKDVVQGRPPTPAPPTTDAAPTEPGDGAVRARFVDDAPTHRIDDDDARLEEEAAAEAEAAAQGKRRAK